MQQAQLLTHLIELELGSRQLLPIILELYHSLMVLQEELQHQIILKYLLEALLFILTEALDLLKIQVVVFL